MKTKFLTNKMLYDGSQLSSLYAYIEHGLHGDSIVAWIGPCDIPFGNMADAEDEIDKSEIRGSLMLHFLVEVFHQNLFSAVALQRLFAEIIRKNLILNAPPSFKKNITRSGDDLYLGKAKLSISIACAGVNSSMIHFAINLSNLGTPVHTACLADCGIKNSKKIALAIMSDFSKEYESILFATRKVRILGDWNRK